MYLHAENDVSRSRLNLKVRAQTVQTDTDTYTDRQTDTTECITSCSHEQQLIS